MRRHKPRIGPWLVDGVMLLIIGFVVYQTSGGPIYRCEIMPDEWYIKRAIERLIDSSSFSIQNRNSEEDRWIRDHYYPYQSIEVFLAENRDCCHFSRRGGDGLSADSIQSIPNDTDLYAFVLADYRIRTVSDGVVRYHRVMPTDVLLSSCGEPVDIW